MHLPHVTPFARNPLFYFTAATAERQNVLAGPVPMKSLTEIWKRSAALDGWFVGRFVLMPDHLHVFASPASDAKSRGDWIKVWKSMSSRQISLETNISQPLWQPDTFDHILRNAKSYHAKWDYVRHNPVRHGLVARTEDWPWQGEIHSLEF